MRTQEPLAQLTISYRFSVQTSELRTLHMSLCSILSICSTILLLPSIASALNGNGRQAFVTYDGWRAFELVTQGDKLDGFEMPGNMDGIGVSSIAYLDSLILSNMPSSNTLIQSTF